MIDSAKPSATLSDLSSLGLSGGNTNLCGLVLEAIVEPRLVRGSERDAQGLGVFGGGQRVVELGHARTLSGVTR